MGSEDGAREHVFEHRLRDPGAASASITVANPDHVPTHGIAVTVTWDVYLKTLDRKLLAGPIRQRQLRKEVAASLAALDQTTAAP